MVTEGCCKLIHWTTVTVTKMHPNVVSQLPAIEGFNSYVNKSCFR